MIGFDFYGSPGDGAELVASYGVDGILFAMVKIVSDRIFKKNQSKKDLKNCTKYSRGNTVKELLAWGQWSD